MQERKREIQRMEEVVEEDKDVELEEDFRRSALEMLQKHLP